MASNRDKKACDERQTSTYIRPNAVRTIGSPSVGQDTVMEEVMGIGAKAFLIKPFDSDKLMQAIRDSEKGISLGREKESRGEEGSEKDQ